MVPARSTPNRPIPQQDHPARPLRSREESSKHCLTCHEFGEEHANFLRSQHLKNNVGCVDCHSVHSPKVNQAAFESGAAQPLLQLPP